MKHRHRVRPSSPSRELPIVKPKWSERYVGHIVAGTLVLAVLAAIIALVSLLLKAMEFVNYPIALATYIVGICGIGTIAMRFTK